MYASTSKTGPSFLGTGGASHPCTKGRKNMQTNKQLTSFTAIELKNLVEAAQRLDEHAINTLCAAFKPLIIAESHKSHIIAQLGDDSENIAWEIFLATIQSYHGNKYRLLPGLLQKQLHFELMHKAYPRSSTPTVIMPLEDLEAGSAAGDAYSKNNINDLLDKEFFADILRCLTKKQRDIIDALYRHQMSLTEYCSEQSITYTAAYYLEKRALRTLRKLMTMDVFTNVNTQIGGRARRKVREKILKRDGKKKLP